MKLSKYSHFNLDPTVDSQQERDILEEIELMKEIGQHKYIVSMIGCVTKTFPPYLILEYIPDRDLLHHLRDKRSKVVIYQTPFAFKMFTRYQDGSILLSKYSINSGCFLTKIRGSWVKLRQNSLVFCFCMEFDDSMAA